jgi:hypothetical protein
MIKTIEYKGYKAEYRPEFFSRVCGCMIDAGYVVYLNDCKVTVDDQAEFEKLIDSEFKDLAS